MRGHFWLSGFALALALPPEGHPPDRPSLACLCSLGACGRSREAGTLRAATAFSCGDAANTAPSRGQASMSEPWGDPSTSPVPRGLEKPRCGSGTIAPADGYRSCQPDIFPHQRTQLVRLPCVRDWCGLFGAAEGAGISFVGGGTRFAAARPDPGPRPG